MATLAAEAAVATEGTLRSADGTKLAYRSWPTPSAPITFAVVHGLGEHSGRYERFAAGMARHGMATYAVDLRGHGKSEGQRGHVDSWSQWIDDAAAFVAHVESEAPGEVVPLGHSFGGAVMLSTVRAGKLVNAKRFVVSSPALRLKVTVPAWKSSLAGVASRLAPRLAMDNEVNPATVSRIPEVVEAYRTDPLVHSKISSRLYAEWWRAAADNLEQAGDIRIPFLILAGSADPLIDPAGSAELHRRSPAMSELRILDGRYHEPFNDLGSDEVFGLLANWLGK
ncbi:MAG: lysophospholipase [Chloroflexi bacterium]|nr:MAG: lysophospholipase [Chloroflexota bacterium]